MPPEEAGAEFGADPGLACGEIEAVLGLSLCALCPRCWGVPSPVKNVPSPCPPRWMKTYL